MTAQPIRLTATLLIAITFVILAQTVLGPTLFTPADARPAAQPLTPPPHHLTYQGYLTDGAGNPLDGSYRLDFSLHDALSEGKTVWGPESHAAVSVQQGLFNAVLGQTIELAPKLFQQALFLEVTINQTATLSRQPLRPVAQAFSLLPGATIQGQPLGSVYGLTVINQSTDAQSRGLWVVGEQHGLVVQETGAGDVALKSTSFVEAQGYKSVEPSYWWTAGMQGLPVKPLTMQPTLTGTVILSSSVAGPQLFYLPLSVPSELYGQTVSMSELRLDYRTSHADSYIAGVRLAKSTSVDEADLLIDEAVRLDSTVATSHPMTTTGNISLTAESGPLNLQLTLELSEPTHTILIRGARLRLTHR